MVEGELRWNRRADLLSRTRPLRGVRGLGRRDCPRDEGEEASENWKTFSSSAVLVSLSALQSGAEIREFASLRSAAVEMRGLVHDAAGQAELRERRAAKQDRESAAQQERVLPLTKWLVAPATLTVAAAIVTLAVTIAG